MPCCEISDDEVALVDSHGVQHRSRSVSCVNHSVCRISEATGTRDRVITRYTVGTQVVLSAEVNATAHLLVVCPGFQQAVGGVRARGIIPATKKTPGNSAAVSPS